MNKILMGLLSIPKTIYFNFKAFPVSQAVWLPVFVSL